jgi:AraC family transcriptional regulator, ethanolamine operon transcriptional activator
MPEAQRIPLEWEPDISTETVGLSEFNPDALSHVVSGAEFEHRRLPGGGSSVNLLQCCLPHSVINRGVYSPAVLVSGTFAPTAITIGTMLQQKEQTILNGSNVRMGTIQFYSERSEMCYRAWPDATWLAFVISRERLAQFCIDHLEETPDLPKTGIATIEPESQQSGDQFLDRLRDLDHSLRLLGSLPNAARLGESVENDLLARIATFISGKSVKRRANDRSRLHKCDEMLRDTMKLVEEDPSDMLDLRSMSKATGLSPRTLQRTFQAEYGLCPQEWLRVERLNRVRTDLLNAKAHTSVTQTATRWGFFHFGRFSQYYRELFGERPSETLARSVPA